MIDLGPWFDDRPLARCLVPIIPVFLTWAIIVGVVQPATSFVERKTAEVERMHGWSKDWRGRPRRELVLPDDTDGGESPTMFTLVCRKDADGKVAHAVIQDDDGLPGLPGLKSGDSVRVTIENPEALRNSKWRTLTTTWHLEKPGYLVSENDVHAFLRRDYYQNIAQIRISDEQGNQSYLKMPHRGLRQAKRPFFDDCKLPLLRPNFVRERGSYHPPYTR